MKDIFPYLGGGVLLVFFAWLKYRLCHFKKAANSLKEDISRIYKKEKISKDALAKKKIKDKSRDKSDHSFDPANPYSGVRGAKKKH